MTTPGRAARLAILSTELVRHRRGRPPLSAGEPSVPATVNLPASIYDRLARRAARERIDFATLLRRALTEYSNEKLSAPATRAML